MKITFNHISKKINETASAKLIFKYAPKKLNEDILTEDDETLDLTDNEVSDQENDFLATTKTDLTKLQNSLSELKEIIEQKKAELEQSVTATAGNKSPDEEAKKRLDTKQECVDVANEIEKSADKIDEFIKKFFSDELAQLKANLDNSKKLAN